MPLEALVELVKWLEQYPGERLVAITPGRATRPPPRASAAAISVTDGVALLAQASGACTVPRRERWTSVPDHTCHKEISEHEYWLHKGVRIIMPSIEFQTLNATAFFSLDT
jgi:hypothetical protein